jgi:hypothetical protein
MQSTSAVNNRHMTFFPQQVFSLRGDFPFPPSSYLFCAAADLCRKLFTATLYMAKNDAAPRCCRIVISHPA